MEERATTFTLDSQEVRKLRRAYQAQSEAKPLPQQLDAGQTQPPGNVMHRPIQSLGLLDDSMSAAPNDFTFNTQSPSSSTKLINATHPNLKPSSSSPTRAPPKFSDDDCQSRKMHYSILRSEDEVGGDTQPLNTQIFISHSDFGSSRIGLGVGLDGTAERNIIEDSEATARKQERLELTDDDDVEKDAQEDDIAVSSPDAPADTLGPEAFARIAADNEHIFKQPYPKTPQLNPSTKRKRPHDFTPDLQTSAAKSAESVAKLFGGFGKSMSQLGNVSQMFRQTQAGSSPAPGAPHSDSPFNRVSPKFNLGVYQGHQFSLSSPIRPSTSDGIPLNGPVNYYRPMDESQESRLRREQRRAALLRRESTEDDEFADSIPSQVRRSLAQRERAAFTSNIELQVRDPIYQSPLTSWSKSVDHLTSEPHIRTPALKLAKPRLISPDLISDAIDDAYLLDTVRNEDFDDVEDINAGRVEVPMTSSKHTRKSQLSHVPSPSSSSHSQDGAVHTQMTVAVQDSQGDRDAVLADEHVTHLAIQSSARSGHMVHQSQYSMTSEKRAMLSSHQRSIAKFEPLDIGKVDADEAGKDNIPSSPPIEFSEHDHDYEEESDIEIVREEEDLHLADVHEEEPPAEFEAKKRAIVGSDPGNEREEEIDLLHTSTPKTQPPEEPSQRNESDTSEVARQLMDGLRSTSPARKKPEHEPGMQGPGTVINNETEQFQTAASHLTPRTSRTQYITRRCDSESHVSPIKRIGDIASVASPRRSGVTNESQELDAVIDNIFSDDDHTFMEFAGDKLDSPSRKRQLRYGKAGNILREPSANANLLLNQKKPNKVGFVDTVTSEGDKGSSSAPDKAWSTPSMAEAQHSAADMPAYLEIREETGAKASLRLRSLVTARKVPTAKGTKRSPKPTTDTETSSKRRRAVNGNEEGGEANQEVDAMIEEQEATNSGGKQEDGNNAVDFQPVSSTPATSSAVRQYLPSALSALPAIVSDAPALHRVIALFKDNKLNFYPATFLETLLSDSSKCKVRFCDSSVAIVDVAQVRSLALRVGDIIKLDIDGKRKGTWVVKGFSEEVESRYADAGGHKAIQVIPHGAPSIQDPEIVAVESLYLTGPMLTAFADRRFTPPSKSSERFATPIPGAGSEPTTPGSRSRRQHLSASMNVPNADNQASSGLFSIMAFAITFVSQSEQGTKSKIERQVKANGGTILDAGFEELFESTLGTTSTSMEPKSRLDLKVKAEALGFTAVIADRHCKTKKYMQALALGLPCLHHRWVSDCIKQATILPFQKYLLAAGEAEFLNGAVLSRDMLSYDPTQELALFRNVIQRRSHPLSDASVFFILSDKRKRETYHFIAIAAGASEVRFTSNYTEAKKLLKARGLDCDWVFYDGDVEQARLDFLPIAKSEKAQKKRKRECGEMNIGGSNKVMRIEKTEVLNQSLILGALPDVDV